MLMSEMLISLKKKEILIPANGFIILASLVRLNFG